jgi:VWFA-related protein
MRPARVTCALLLAGGARLGAQPPDTAAAQQPPVFEVGVDVVAVDVSVIDPSGRPYRGLTSEDFTVKVDGKPRRVVSVESLGPSDEPRAEAPAPAHYSTNEGVEPGRLVVLAVDRGNIGVGGGRAVLKAADRLLDRLTPNDRVALAVLPGGGPSIDFTDDYTRVRQALATIVGQVRRSDARIPLADALAHDTFHDDFRWRDVVNRECFGLTGREFDMCETQLEQEAAAVVVAYRERSLLSLSALAALLEQLRTIEGPKTLVLISEGLGTRDMQDVRNLAAAAGKAQVTLYVVLIQTWGPDASSRAAVGAATEDRDIEAAGLYNLAGLARGALFRAPAGAQGIFEKIAQELSAYYLLGFEPEPGDRDGKNHDIKVEVARPKVTIRARGLLNIPVSAPAPNDQQRILAGLRSPLVLTGLPLRVASFALGDKVSGRVRVLVSGDVGRTSGPVSVGFVLEAVDGKVAVSRVLQVPDPGPGDRVPFIVEMTVAPGPYTLRLAAVDRAGRRGTLRHPVKAALVSAGGVEISDLLLAPQPEPGEGLRPPADLELQGGAMTAHLEVRGSTPQRLASVSVAMEVADSDGGPAILRVPAELSEPGEGGTRLAQVTLAGGLLPPGAYVARAAVSMEGKPVAALTRSFRVLPPRAGAEPGSARGAPLAAMLADTRPFDRGELLRPDSLGHFLDRMSELAPGPVPEAVQAAVREGRQGRPEAMIDRLSGAAKEDVRVAFLRGVGLYARGNLAGALTQLQEVLRLQSDFFPAAVYLGACYAAGGKDLDAVGAWQTALIGETTSPSLYTLLADALLRVREPEEAVEILKEGLATWPADQGLGRRLGLAYAMAGKREEALPLLTAWVDEHPEDGGALFATLALLFQGFAQEAAGAGTPGDRERLVRYAKAYVDGQGPNREVVDRWLKYLRSRP